ncbi:unnamed protein product [Pleuronectes platessa]|uniref:Uncharacterized protein n=1 Tax=Pleuronectes platessa TaxID=8262 RepID=A0A9N7TRJ1_PLEPL|nr:unnamed protein product [Pleuronectes platessa]
MSHPLYNPYESGNQSSSQGPYGLPGVQAERDSRRATSVLGPGSSFSPSVTPANHGGNIQSLQTMPVNYRPEQSRARVNVGDVERSVDSHISRAREEVTSTGQSTRFTYTGTTSYPMSSTSASGGRRQSEVESRSSSLDWLPCYKGSTAADSSNFLSPPASCSRTSSGGSTFNASSDRQLDGQSVPVLGDYDYRIPDKPAAPTETSRPTYTSESASSILLNFGLERDDLEYLVQYPEDQLTPAKLPFILREIRIQKTNRAMTAVESKPYPEPQPFRGASGRDSLTGSGGSSAVLQPSKVIDYGHTSKYVGGVGDEIGRNSGRSANSGGSGSMMLANTSHSQEPPQNEGSSVAKSSYNSVQSSLAPPRIDPAKLLNTQPIQTPQPIVSSASLPRKDGDRTVYMPEACKPLPMKERETDRKLASVTQPSSTLIRGVHPDRPGLVLIGNSDASGAKNPTTTQGKGSVVAEQRQMQQRQQNQIKPIQQNQMPQSQMHRMPQSQMLQSQMHRMPPSQMPPSQMPQSQMLQSQMHQMPPSQMHQMPPSQMPPSQMHQMQQSQMPPSQMPPSQMHQMQQSQMPPSQMHQMQQSQMQPQQQPELSTIIPRPINHPPPQPVLSSMNFPQSQAPSSSQGPAKKPVSKGLPAPGMMYDYAAASPRAFPHTCSLCFKECSQMKHSEDVSIWRKQPDASLRCSLGFMSAQGPSVHGEGTWTDPGLDTQSGMVVSYSNPGMQGKMSNPRPQLLRRLTNSVKRKVVMRATPAPTALVATSARRVEEGNAAEPDHRAAPDTLTVPDLVHVPVLHGMTVIGRDQGARRDRGEEVKGPHRRGATREGPLLGGLT